MQKCLISLTAIDKTSSIYIISQVIWYNDSNMKRGILTWWRSEAFILSFGRETGLLIFSLLVLFLSTISALICVYLFHWSLRNFKWWLTSLLSNTNCHNEELFGHQSLALHQSTLFRDLLLPNTAQNMKFLIDNFFFKYEQIC